MTWAWLEIVEILHHAKRRPLVDRVFEMAEVPKAFARLAEGPVGKVLVKVESKK
jgi:NADPH2:quinone reductase